VFGGIKEGIPVETVLITIE